MSVIVEPRCSEAPLVVEVNVDLVRYLAAERNNSQLLGSGVHEIEFLVHYKSA